MNIPCSTKGIVINRATGVFWRSKGRGVTQDIAEAHHYAYREVRAILAGMDNLQFWPVE